MQAEILNYDKVTVSIRADFQAVSSWRLGEILYNSIEYIHINGHRINSQY